MALGSERRGRRRESTFCLPTAGRPPTALTRVRWGRRWRSRGWMRSTALEERLRCRAPLSSTLAHGTASVACASTAPSVQTTVCSAAGAPSPLPWLSAVRLPRVGEPFELRIVPVRPFSFTVLLLGASNSAWGGVVLPPDLGLLGMLTPARCLPAGMSEQPCSARQERRGDRPLPPRTTRFSARGSTTKPLRSTCAQNAFGVIATNGVDCQCGWDI